MYLVVLGMLSTMFCIGANIISARLGYFGPFVAPMGVFFFPFIYIISDVISDVYGYKTSRKISWMTQITNIVFVFGILLIITLNKPAEWCKPADNALRLLIIGTSGVSGMIRVMLSGIVGAVIGGWINDIIFQWYRNKDGVDKFTKRKLLSSLGAEVIDTVLFITLAFAGTVPTSMLLVMYPVQFVLKYSVECITEPIARRLSKYIRSKEGDVYVNDNSYTLFGGK